MSGSGAAGRLVAEGVPSEAIRGRLIDTVVYANDASHYLLTPEVVVQPADAGAVSRLMEACGRQGLSVTFRSGGTSLSGQAVSDGVLVDTRKAFRGIEVLENGRAVLVEPGATVRAVNTALRRHGFRLGPDPASEGACTIGGVVANNSSGMTCGTQANTYRTLRSLCFILPSGTTVDTAEHDADQRLAAAEPDLHRGLLVLRDRVRGDAAMVATIEAQFSMKNTMGYGVNAFLDFDRPVDILAHLIVGSEGTLAFVASATLATVPVLPEASTGLLVFPGLEPATQALGELMASGAVAIELLDAQSLRVAAADSRATAGLRALTVRNQAALLVEYQAASADGLAELVNAARPRFDWSAGGGQPLTSDPRQRSDLWHVRKGLYAAVAGARRPGTTALLEDIAVPVPALSDTCSDLVDILMTHGYQDCVIFGHAKDGNIHFMLTESFDGPEGVRRYASFTEEMVDLVLGRGGTLKAEHGTGRVMASFVQRQYGDDIFEVMRQVKRLCDPRGVLNPGVLLTDDPAAHLQALKTTTPVEQEVDRCVECGFCEPVCPSRDLTLTPRQRIVARRAAAAARARGDHASVDELETDYEYDGLQTCAADGMCQTACPVSIDTGSLVRRLRAQEQRVCRQAASRWAARHWDGLSQAASAALTAARRAPVVATWLSRAARAVAGAEAVPLWSPDLPKGGARRLAVTTGGGAGPVVLFASCTNALFGPEGGRGATEALWSLCAKAGVGVVSPPGIAGLCCGMPWSSKGLTGGAAVMAERLRTELWDATRNGRLPVVVDASSCTEGLAKVLRERGMRVEDAVTFAARELLPRLDVRPTTGTVAVHPTCSATRMGTSEDLLALASALGRNTFVPDSWGCCGFAGDRGMLHPSLTAAATAAQAREVAESGADVYVSCNRTCELGMTRAVGRAYRHVLQLLDELAHPRDGQARLGSHRDQG